MKRYIRFYVVTDAFRNSVQYAHETTEQLLKRYKNTAYADLLQAFLESIPGPGEFVELGGMIVMRAIDQYVIVPESADDLFTFEQEFKSGMG